MGKFLRNIVTDTKTLEP